MDQELDARHAKQLQHLFPVLGPQFSLAILLFSIWDFWRDPANAGDALLIRCLLVALGALVYLPPAARLPPLYRCGFLFVTHICALILAEFMLRDGFLYGLAGITSCLFLVSVMTLQLRAFLAIVAVPTVLLVVLTVQRMPLAETVNQLMLYAFAIALALALMFVIRSFALQTLQLEAQLLKSARHDGLTGVCNRAYLFEQAENAVALARRHRRPLAVAMLDIDHFKRVNDTYGHAVGDSVIRALADTCMSELRTNDRFGRIGGEEFVCVMPETDEAEALQCAERLRNRIGALAVETSAGPLSFTVSVGVAMLRQGCDNWPELLHAADCALYGAKGAGRDRVVLAA
ncbi:GGDEF domain-containing protein [Pseudoduganella sp. UC29_106]|uniref:GGDEF domain-containing protein n=1 Tax=Pseudoduganella sp. UC29_106 TaxID=3374553 RepID=UPI0037572F7E